MDDELDFNFPGASPGPPVRGERVKFLRQLQGLTPTQVAKALRTSTTSVNNWEAGTKQPTKFLTELCALLEVAAESLSFGIAPRPTMGPLFRSDRAGFEKVRDQATAYGCAVAEIATYFDRRVGLDLPSIADLLRQDGASPEYVARAARVELGLPPGPIMNMIRVVERAGVVVSYSEGQRSSIDGYSLKVGPWPIVVLTPRGNYYRQRWDVAHEFGHLLMHPATRTYDPDMETEANQFAAEFLAPAASIRNVLPFNITAPAIEDFKRLKETWGISISALIRRSYELGTMHRATFDHAQGVLDRKGWRRGEPGLMETLEMPSLLADAIGTYQARGIDRSLMIRETGLPARIFESATSRYPLDIFTNDRFEA